MRKTKISSRKKSVRKLSKKAKVYTKKRTHADLPVEWVMPFDASFPRENTVDFILDDDDKDRAVIFQYDGEFDE